MASLGSFGVRHEPEVVEEETTFDWFGTEIRLPVLAVSQMELVDLMEMATSTDDTDPGAVVVVKKLFRMVIHPDDFQQFWNIGIQNRQQIDDLMPVFQVLLEAATARPTRQPSDSSSGRPVTPAASPVSSSSTVEPPGRTLAVETMREGTLNVDRSFVTTLTAPAPAPAPGRPDLVLLLQSGQETREQLAAAAG